ncbi:MAG: hypothetical protein ACHQRK_08735 [Gemmatimonadales bacterium]
MKVIHRLYLMMSPAIVAMLLLAALAYWGQYGREAPENLTGLGAIVVLASLATSWANARYVARRLERLSVGGSQRGPARPHAPRDEIDEIERVVDRLSGEVETATTDSAHSVERYDRRAREYARLLVAVADSAADGLEEVRLPLHILLENHFGELNENQEEMLGAARAAAEALDADIISIRQIAELDLNEQPLRRDRVRPAELIEAIRPMLNASAEAAGVTLELEVAPLLPAITGDSARLQDATVTLVRAMLVAAHPEARVRVAVTEQSGSVTIVISGGGEPIRSIRWVAATRVIQAHGGVVDESGDALSISVPVRIAG